MSTSKIADSITTTCTVPEGEPVPVIKGSHVYLVDGSGYIFRAFHALPPLTRPSDGLPVGAVHGFCQMLWKLLADSKASEAPTHIAVVFDHSAKTFRNDIYADYKANRPPPPEELIPQFPLIRTAVQAFNVACIEQEGYEADDLIATFGRQALDAGADVTIISSDKDLMQLVRPGLVMIDGMKNKRIGPDEVREKFGVPPDKVVDVQALAGDSVDNVPGVPGIGVKTAAELINTFGDLDALLERAGEIKQPKRRERLTEFADQARVSRDLVRLDANVPVNVKLEALGVRDPEAGSLLGFLQEMEFNTLTRRIAEKLGAEPPPALKVSVGVTVAKVKTVTVVDDTSRAASSPGGAGTPGASVAHGNLLATEPAIDRTKYETVTTTEQLSDWITRAYETGHFAFDTETTGLDAMQVDLVGLSIATEPGAACYVPLGHVAAGGGLDFGGESDLVQMPIREALDLLKPLLEDPSILKIGQNLKYDCLVMQRYGIRLNSFDDTMLISYALDGGRGGHGMDELAMRHLGHSCVPFSKVIETAPGGKKATKTFAAVPIDKATEYAAEDAEVTLRLWHKLKPRLVAERMTSVYETLERPLVRIITDMECSGIKVDRTILSRLSGTFQQRIAALEAEVHELAGDTFNLGSPRQLGVLLFDKLKLPGGKKTKNGQWETRASLLDDLANNEDLPEDARRLVLTMLEWRQLSKLRSTYTDALPNYIHPESGRIHTSYAMASTTTGRLASSDPNLQNIPIRTKEGREIRTAFISSEGAKLISADYSQIELRVLAHIADIAQLKQAFADGLDIHAMTASEMFGVPVEGMPGEVRRRAKAINFGIIYGISAFGLANQLGISREEAGQYIKTYFERFPGIRDYMDQTKKFAHENGYVTTIFGRHVHYPEINTRNPSMRGFLERAAINAPIQGSAADIIRRAMVRMPAALENANLRSARMLLQVHDELIFEVADADVDRTIETVRSVMEGAAEPAVRLSVPIHVDAKAADNWEAAH
ncbi:DNA polymerase I [Candidatus Filomicrobium marinum]|uniref:DNA polymerase I n=1 Tax=Candidatus Filomicrobium marinum TaxID=1608628 RepID=A0A0D6JE01_9HYPH|nr:DNA polymerase I [Candidatus Filomicrobium marinum]CFX16170.1 DNA polymerase I [Candidatus Filomicrobium marinum]CPR18060.1 DNA polymerase I [Candidatus Filomicrobium marinum]